MSPTPKQTLESAAADTKAATLSLESELSTELHQHQTRALAAAEASLVRALRSLAPVETQLAAMKTQLEHQVEQAELQLQNTLRNVLASVQGASLKALAAEYRPLQTASRAEPHRADQAS